jgi:hypothetical protein
MTQENSREIIERLQDLIRKHRVCYEVWPENLVVNQQIVKVGFALELEGTHEQPESEVQPGCPHCEEVFKDLQRIAEWIMPAEGRPTTYEIQPFDRAIRYSPKRKRRPEVSLTIKIIHRQGFDQPVDECEQMCLKEMRRKLAELGVLEGEINDSGLSHDGG